MRALARTIATTLTGRFVAILQASDDFFARTRSDGHLRSHASDSASLTS